MILLLQSSVFESVSPKIARDIRKVICDNFGIFWGMQREFTNQIDGELLKSGIKSLWERLTDEGCQIVFLSQIDGAEPESVLANAGFDVTYYPRCSIGAVF